MTRRSIRQGGVLGVALVAGLAVSGVAWAASPSATATTSDTVITTAFDKPIAFGGTVIFSVTLPPDHSYVIEAQGDIVNFQASEFVRCMLLVDGFEIGAAATIVGNPALPGSQGPAAIVSSLSASGGVKVGAAPATAEMICSPARDSGAGPYLDARATSMVVHRTASVQLLKQ